MDASAREMNANTGTVRPFQVTFPDSDLDRRRRRIKATRLPEKEPVSDMSQGLPLAAERAYPNPMYFNNIAKGGHYADWEQPRLFTEELHAGLRPLRRY